MPSVGRAEVGKREAVLVPRADDFVTQAEEGRHTPADLPVVLRKPGDVVRMAVERTAVGDLIAGVYRAAEQEVGEGVAGDTPIKPVLATEIDAKSEAVARHVARPETARLQRMPALDPREVVAQREGVLPHGPVHVAGGVHDVRRPVGAGVELEGGEAEAIGRQARSVFDAERRRHVGCAERALAARIVVVVPGAQLVYDRRAEDPGPAADHRAGIEVAIEDRRYLSARCRLRR